MKAILDQDVIVRLAFKDGTEIGALPPGVGLERLRFDGENVVDLADLSQIWVHKKHHNTYILHAIQVPDSQLITMTWADRKRLRTIDNVTTLLTVEEETNEKEEARLRAQLRRLDQRSLVILDDLIEILISNETVALADFLAKNRNLILERQQILTELDAFGGYDFPEYLQLVS